MLSTVEMVRWFGEATAEGLGSDTEKENSLRDPRCEHSDSPSEGSHYPNLHRVHRKHESMQREKKKESGGGGSHKALRYQPCSLRINEGKKKKERKTTSTDGRLCAAPGKDQKKKNDGQPPHTIALSRLSQRLHKQISCTLPGVRLDSAAAQDVLVEAGVPPSGALGAEFQSRSGMLKALRRTSRSGHQTGKPDGTRMLGAFIFHSAG